MYGEQQTTLFKHLSIKGILKRIDHVIHKTKLHVQFIYITAKVEESARTCHYGSLYRVRHYLPIHRNERKWTNC